MLLENRRKKFITQTNIQNHGYKIIKITKKNIVIIYKYLY